MAVVFEWRRHMAFRGMFRLLDDGWCLEIRQPTDFLLFTQEPIEQIRGNLLDAPIRDAW